MGRAFGALLRSWRREAGKNLEETAALLGVKVPYLSQVELGHRPPLRTDRILAVAEYFGHDPRPALALAAEERGAFELDASRVPPEARELGAALMRGWDELTADDAATLNRAFADILKRKEKEK
jgi:transcriptional regulator with XRE-family HTH domain